MLIDAKRSCLLVIDVQEKLVPGVQDSQQLIDNCRWMIAAAQLFRVPVLASEQYPQGVGPTVPALRELVADDCVKGKLHFACTDESSCLEMIQQQDCDQWILVGMEAHVCVLQTAIRLTEQGKQVFVVADAISSRSPHDIEFALERLRSLGVQIVTREMVGFEWLRRSDAEEFRAFSKGFLQ